MYFLFALIPYAVQVLLIIHVIKTGRQTFWIFLILFVPYIGGVVYVIVELLPDLLHGRTGRTAGRVLSRAINPGGDLRQLEEQLKIQNTVSNKLSLAAAYAQAERYADSIALYRECLSGPYANDPTILFPLAQALYFSNQAAEARQILDALKKAKVFDRLEEQLLDVLVREASGETVLPELALLYERNQNFEAGYYYVRSLVRSGDREKAASVVAAMKETARHFRQFRKTMGRDWLAKSEAELNT